jgi:hypothetical protein
MSSNFRGGRLKDRTIEALTDAGYKYERLICLTGLGATPGCTLPLRLTKSRSCAGTRYLSSTILAATATGSPPGLGLRRHDINHDLPPSLRRHASPTTFRKRTHPRWTEVSHA